MLLPFYMDRRWGYIDEYARWVVPPRFQNCGRFTQGLAPVCKEERYGYIDVLGREVIPRIFDWGGNFYDGVACVQVGGKFAIIDQTGRLLIRPTYDALYPFDRNARLFCAQNEENKWGIIERIGTTRLHFKYDDVEGVEDDWWKTSLECHHSFFDENWRFMKSFEYDDMTLFHHGLSVVDVNARKGVVDKNGNDVLPLQYEDVFVCSSERVCLRSWGGNDYSFFYPNTKQWGRLRFDHCDGELENGLAIVSKNGLCSLYDSNEKCKLPDFAEAVQTDSYGRFHRFWVDDERMGYMRIENDRLFILNLDGLREKGMFG